MKIIADVHTHTLASGHAYSTVLENLQVAKRKGLKFLAITDHTGIMPDAPHETYFFCMQSGLPDEYDGVYILRGCEANILNEKGELDISTATLDRLEWVIASIHGLLTAPMDFDKHTELWLNVAKNKSVDVIGHCGEEKFKFDYERGVQAFKEHGKIVEINASSYKTRSSSRANCLEIAKLCAKHEVPIVLSSDAHFASAVGDVADAIKIVTQAEVPEKLILNADAQRFAQKLREMTGRRFKV
jgi:putative hydrolase